MFIRILNIVLIATLWIACNSKSADELAREREGLLNQMAQLKSQLKTAASQKATKELYQKIIDTKISFVNQFPKDPASPGELFGAGEMAQGIGEYDLAIEIWDRITKKYNQHEHAPKALFAQGFLYDSILKDAENAKRYYDYFLALYPEHQLAEEVQQLLSIIESGKSMDTLIKEFEQNNQENLK